MRLRISALVALVGVATAQNLTTLLANTSDLSNLTAYLGLYPDFTQALASMTNVTLLAPNNGAFARLVNSSAGAAISANDTVLIQSLLSYHILNGTYHESYFSANSTFLQTMLNNPLYSNVTGGQRLEAREDDDDVVFYSGLLSNASVTGSELNFTGGVIHIIESFLTIPQNVSTTAVAFNLTSAVGALGQANLVDTVDGLTDVTIFIPNNEAFQAIASELADASIETLISVLQYHVVNGTVAYSSDLSDDMNLTTADGSVLRITIEDNRVFVNSAEVVVPDLLVANGVVHVIDNVLNPQNTTATPNPSASTQVPAFTQASTASSATTAPFTSGVATPTSSVATTGAASSTQSGVAPIMTGAMGAAALFGGAAALMNL